MDGMTHRRMVPWLWRRGFPPLKNHMGYEVTMVDLFRFMALHGPEDSDEEDWQ